MKQKLNYQIYWGLSLIAILAFLNFGRQTIAQLPTRLVDTALASEVTNNSPTPTISARNLFRNAYDNRYTWGPQFPGYTAAVEFKQGKERYKGHVRVNRELAVNVIGIDNQDAHQAIQASLGMIIIHHQRVPFDQEHKNSTFKFGATDPSGAVNIFEQGDETAAHYKVLDNQIVQVNRFLGATAVTVDVLNFKVTPQGYLPTRYRSIFYQPQTKQIIGKEESEDIYKKIGDYYVLTHQIVRDFNEQGEPTDSMELSYADIQLLSK